MSLVQARGVRSAQSDFEPMVIERREPGPHDVLIDIAYAGICHSDIEHARSLRGPSMYPLVPGHEIAGLVRAVGAKVQRFAIGDRVGVGNMVDSCRQCQHCQAGLEQYCSGRRILTYNCLDHQGQPTYGGYSQQIVVDEHFVLRIPDAIPLKNAAPLLCAGITLYSPLREWGAGPGKKVGIIGLGGLGHMGVKLAHAMGAHVTVLSHSPSKKADALRLGADEFLNTNERSEMRAAKGTFDLIINTVSANIDMNAYLNLLKVDGTLVLVGLPENPISIGAFSLTAARRRLAGSQIGGIRETQEMLDFCGEHNIVSDVEVIPAEQLNEAWERVVNSDVRYRFVIDTSTF